MSSSSGGNKSKRKRVKNLFKELFQSPSTGGSNVQQPGSISSSTTQDLNCDIVSSSDVRLDVQPPGLISSSTIQANATQVLGITLPSPSQLGTGSRPKESDGITPPPTRHSNTTEVSGAVGPSLAQSNIKEGLGITGRFVQTLLKKLPDCVDGNPVKMALSIVKTIIDIKDEIGDNKDTLTDSLRSTQRLLSDAIGKVDFLDSEEVKKEMEDYKRKIEEQNIQLLQIAKELESMLRHVDYENYRNKINNICKDINETTDVFMFRMQVEIRTKTALMHDRMEEEKKARLTKSLRDLNPSKKADHRTVLEGQSLKREICTEGTRVKILEEITNWANDPTTNSPHVFWLTGQAGSGKTTIAYTIAKRFEKGQSTILGANFLCSRQFEETRSINRILPTIAYQLAYKCEPYQTTLHAHVGDKSAVVDHEVSEQIQELLVGPWSGTPRLNDRPTYLVVIDALDEVSDEGGSKILHVLLTTINQQNLFGLKFLVTSRTDPRIVNLCEGFSSKAVCRLQDVPIEDAEADVGKYLDAKLPNFVASPELGELNRRASGLFIYAATAVRILTKPTSITKKEQTRRLNHLISTTSGLSVGSKDKSAIDELYEQIMYEAFSEFPEDDMAPRLRILYSYLCAAERISPSVAAILMDDDYDVAKAVLENLHAVLYIEDERVFWYHASFPDFIFAKSRSNFHMGGENFEFWCDEGAQQNLLTLSCLRVMNSEVDGLRFNMGDITSSYLLDVEHIDELSEHVNKNITPVLRYSSFHWAQHLLSSSLIQNVNHICDCISDFLHIRVIFWIEAMNLLGESSECISMLHLARQWVLSSKCSTVPKSALARDLLESANFATYFTGSPAAKSTPHLYISSMATWKQQSRLSQNWKNQFSHNPHFTHVNDGNDVPLLTIHVPEAAVYAVAFSNDGMRVASGSQDASVRIWKALTGKEVKILKGHISAVYSVAFLSDDKWIASGSDDCTVRVWDVSTGECLRVMEGHTKSVNSVAFSGNGLRLVSGSDDKSIRVWDILMGGVIKVITGHTQGVNSVALSGDGGWAASGSIDGSVRVWDTSTGEELSVMNGHTEVVTSVAISGDNTRIASGSQDCSVRIWNAATGEELRVIEVHEDWVDSVTFSGNGAWVISGSSDCFVRVWDASSGKALKALKGHKDHVYSTAVSTDATRVVSGSYDGSVRVWNVSTSAEFHEHKGRTNSVTSVAFSSDGTRALFGSNHGSVHVWDATTQQELNVLEESTQLISSVAVSNDGTHIAWGSGDKVCVWDVMKNVKVKVLEDHTSDVHSVTFSSDGTLIASGSEDCTVRLWDVLKGVELKVLDGHTSWIRSVAFSGDGKHIVSGSNDNSVRVWDVSTGGNLMVIEGHSNSVLSVAFSSDSARIVSGSRDNIVRVWDAWTGTELKVLRGHTGWVYSVAFSSDDTYIVSGSRDHTVRVWDVSTGEEINTLQGRHTNAVNSIAVSSDGRSIISGSWDGSVVVWGLDNPSWYTGEKNWILSAPSNDRLMWVPPDAIGPQRSNCHVLTGQHNYSSINFENSTMGPAWSQCYTPTHLAHSI